MFNIRKKKELKYITASGYPGDGNWIDNAHSTSSFDKADIVIFEGGTDVSPTLYNEKAGIHTQVKVLQERDKRECELYHKALNAKKYMVAICRGEQLLTILNGGKLVQHMNHPSQHICKTWDGQTCSTNSLHHQLAYPWDIPKEDWELLMWTEGLSNTYLNGDNKEIEFNLDAFTDEGLIIEPEGMYFPKTRCLTVQFHPEMMGYNSWYWNTDGGNDIHTLDYLNKLLMNTFENTNYIKEQKLILQNNV